jgi:hypothetical protein
MPELNSAVIEALMIVAGTLLALALGRLITHQAGKISLPEPRGKGRKDLPADTRRASEVRFFLPPLVIALLGVLLVLLWPIFPLYSTVKKVGLNDQIVFELVVLAFPILLVLLGAFYLVRGDRE